MTKEIPEHIQKKIFDEYENSFAEEWKIVAATFGYSLASKQLEEKEKEIERLKGLIKKEITAYVLETGCGETLANEAYEKFKIKHNL